MRTRSFLRSAMVATFLGACSSASTFGGFSADGGDLSNEPEPSEEAATAGDGGKGKDAGRRDAASSDAGKSDAAKTDAAKSDAAKADGASAEAGLATDPEWVVTYFAGSTSTGPGGLNGSTGLESTGRQVAIFSNGDFAVAGDEEYNAGGSSGIRWTDAFYVFDGATGGLKWKEVGHFLTQGNFVAASRKLVGIDAQDALYVAGRWQVAKVTQGGQLVWKTPLVTSGHALYAKIHDLGGAAAQDYCTSGAVDGSGNSVVVGGVSGDLAKPGTWAIAQRFDPSGNAGWMVHETDVSPTTGSTIRSGTLTTFGADYRNDTPQGGYGVAMWRLSLANGASTVTAVTPPSGVSTTDPGGYVRNWTPMAMTELADGSFALVVDSSFYDDADEPLWLWHVSSTGALLHSKPFAAGEEFDGVAATPEGLVVLGQKGLVGAPIVRRFDGSLTLLGDHAISGLGTKPARMRAGATRDGATILVGHFLPAMPSSAAKVELMERTHFD